MARNGLGVFSFIVIILSLIFFFLPIFLGSSILEIFFLISLGLLFIAFFTSMFGLNYDRAGNLSGLSLSSLVMSILFLLFLIIGGTLQA